MAASHFEGSSFAERQLLPPERKRAAIWPWLVLAAVMAVFLIVRGTTPGNIERRGVRHPAHGKLVADFALLPLTGNANEVTLGTLDGKVSLINFWGPWCPACIVEFPHLVELAQHHESDERFQFFSVSSNFDPSDETGLAESTAQFLRDHKASFPTYRDPLAATTRSLVAAFQVEDFGYPATFLIGSDRRVLGLWIGYVPGDEKEMEQAIAAALRDLNSR